jgi:GLPGLI family protein
MNRIFNLVFFVLLPYLSLSQVSNSKGLVLYVQMESIGQGKNNGAPRPAILVFDKTISSYVSQKDSLDNLLSDKETKSIFLNENGEGGAIILSPTRSKNGSQVITDLARDSVWSSMKIDIKYFTKEARTKINWQLQKETKKIGNFECKSAKCMFRGRNYTAWYAPELAVPFGPWKLQGLPGLILEAYDEKEEIYFYFKSVEFPTKNTTSLIKEIDRKLVGSKGYAPYMTVKETLDMIEDLLVKWYETLIVNSPNGKFRKQDISVSFKEISE